MSRGAKLTILGLYEFNEDIFQGFNVPDGMDRETALNEILLQCGNLELIYPSYNILKLATNRSFQNYMFNLYHKTEENQTVFPFYYLLDSCAEKIPGGFLDKHSKNYINI